MRSVEPSWPYDPSTDFVDFTVMATDGTAGTVDAATYSVPPGRFIVRGGLRDTWRQTILSDRVITDVDPSDRTVHVKLSRMQIRSLPEFTGTVDRTQAD